MKVSCLESPACSLSMTRKEVDFPLDYNYCPLVVTCPTQFPACRCNCLVSSCLRLVSMHSKLVLLRCYRQMQMKSGWLCL